MAILVITTPASVLREAFEVRTQPCIIDVPPCAVYCGPHISQRVCLIWFSQFLASQSGPRGSNCVICAAQSGHVIWELEARVGGILLLSFVVSQGKGVWQLIFTSFEHLIELFFAPSREHGKNRVHISFSGYRTCYSHLHTLKTLTIRFPPLYAEMSVVGKMGERVVKEVSIGISKGVW